MRLRLFAAMVMLYTACGPAASGPKGSFGYLMLRLSGPDGITNVRVSGSVFVLAFFAVLALGVGR